MQGLTLTAITAAEIGTNAKIMTNSLKCDIKVKGTGS